MSLWRLCKDTLPSSSAKTAYLALLLMGPLALATILYRKNRNKPWAGPATGLLIAFGVAGVFLPATSPS